MLGDDRFDGYRFSERLVIGAMAEVLSCAPADKALQRSRSTE